MITFIVLYLIGAVISYGVTFAYIENRYKSTGGVKEIEDYTIINVMTVASLAGLVAIIIATRIENKENVFKYGIQFTKNKQQ